VISPLEQQINGVENAIYTNSTRDARRHLLDYRDVQAGHRSDIAQVQTQNRVAQGTATA